MKEILFFIGSRSNYGRLYQLMSVMRESGKYSINIILACSASDSDDLPDTFNIPGKIVARIEADMYHDTKDNMALTMSLLTIQVSNHLLNNKYDLAVCHGDRFETLGFAIACSYSELPLVHMEAGETSGNIDDKVRWAISSLADLCLCPTFYSTMALASLGCRYNAKFVGSPAVEYVLNNKARFKKASERPYIVVLYNPSQDCELIDLIDFIRKISTTIYWVNPNIDPGNKLIVEQIHVLEQEGLIIFKKNLKMDGYLTLLANCSFLIGNTSSGIKEAAVLEVPYILIGDRQKNREKEDNVSIGYPTDTNKWVSDTQKNYKYQGTFGGLNNTKNCMEYIDEILRSVEH